MPKLPKGMFQRGGVYYCRVTEGGKRRWVRLGGEYEGACRELRKIRLNGDAGPSPATVQAAVPRWLRTYCATARSPLFAKTTAYRADHYLIAYMGQKPLNRVKKDHLRAYRLWLETQSISAQTVAHVLADARCFFYWCEEEGLIDRSPMPRRLLPKIQQRPPDRLSDEEVEAVLSVPEPYAWVARLALGTGLRWGELARVQRTDFQDGTLIVHQTKSGKLRRVPLAPALAAEVQSRIGKLVAVEGGAVAFRRIVRKLSGVSHFHPHQLRHTFACRWLERGGNLSALQEILGHASVTTTQRYARLSDEMVKREAERVYGGGR